MLLLPFINEARLKATLIPPLRRLLSAAPCTNSILKVNTRAPMLHQMSNSFASRHRSHGPGPSYLTVTGNRSSSGGITTNRRRLHYGRSCSSSNDNKGGGCSQGTSEERTVHSKRGGNSTAAVARSRSNVCEGALVTGGEATGSGSGSTASAPVPPRQKGGRTGDSCGGHDKPWIAHQRPKSSRPSPRPRSRLGSTSRAACNGSREESTSFAGRGFPSGDRGDVVTIHVCDEGRGITRGEGAKRSGKFVKSVKDIVVCRKVNNLCQAMNRPSRVYVRNVEGTFRARQSITPPTVILRVCDGFRRCRNPIWT